MVRFDNLIEIFALANDNRSLVGFVVVVKGRGLHAALRKGDFFWEPFAGIGVKG
jgi:hypothetical protein